ncbi:zinc finger protein 90-like [Pollicipes pollicipes]|uniref:zinc finger protein 90-like n=1 Tax=Pollicipes pollicipes TaxID=41117 RepID=UPI0018856EB1|nr:zinc finger protein 90-like [Pollicipes pollicipes]
MVFHKGEKKHACARCGARFVTAKLLRQHMIKHSEIREFVCPHCPHRFKTKAFLDSHVLTHLAREHRDQAPCPHCDATFLSSYGLRSHVAARHAAGEEPTRCDKCQKAFSNAMRLKYHQKRTRG